MIHEEGKPITYQGAIQDPNWVHAINLETESIMRNQVWTYTLCPPNVKPITARWIFKLKPWTSIIPSKHKAWVVARSYQQWHSLDFQKTFAPTVRWELIRTITALIAHHHWILYHMDVSTAFLNSSLDEPIYMIPPPGFLPLHMSHLVCKMSKSLYELKQSPRQWYGRIDYDLLSLA